MQTICPDCSKPVKWIITTRDESITVEREETTIYTERGVKVSGNLPHICGRGDDEGEIRQTGESNSSA